MADYETTVTAFKMFGARVCIISDAMKACGLPDGEYELGGQPVFVKDGCATLANGTIAATINHARAIGEEGSIGINRICERQVIPFILQIFRSVRAPAGLKDRAMFAISSGVSSISCSNQRSVLL